MANTIFITLINLFFIFVGIESEKKTLDKKARVVSGGKFTYCFSKF